MAYSRMKFMNTEIDNVAMDEALQAIDEMVRLKAVSYVVTPNVDHIVRLEKDREFRAAYENADLILTDGMPLIWISEKYGTPIKEKVSGSDLFPKLCRLAADRGYTMFFLGAAEGVADMAARKLTEKNPGLKVTGTYSPAFGFENDPEEIENIIEMIRKAQPDILIVCLGAPKQEKFIFRYRQQMGVPVSLGLGASIDFAAGVRKRAPKWMRNHGLEWLYRLIQEPGRLIGRVATDFVMINKLMRKYK